MLDINLIRENPEKIKQACQAKNVNPGIVDEVLSFDELRRKRIKEIEEVRRKRNELAASFKGKPDEKTIIEGKKLKEELAELETGKEGLKIIEQKLKEKLSELPNPPTADVKPGKNEAENEILRKYSEPTKFSFSPKDHLELGEKLGIIDVQRAAKVSGSRFYYLKGDGVLLELALIQFALETLIKEGFIPVIPPTLIKKEMMGGMGYLEHGGEEDMYVLEKDNLVLVGTSEQVIGPMHSGEIFEAKDLPRRYVGFSSCYRREAGSYGKDTKGILRDHQFDKVEMFSLCLPKDGDKEHEYFLSLEEKFYQALKIPYQVVKMCSGDLGAPAARKYDLEAWMPGQNKYREVTSTSTTTDFQSRRLNIKFKENGRVDYLHMLNGTAFAMSRTPIVILENYQQEDGSVKIPEVLQKYMGKKVIRPR